MERAWTKEVLVSPHDVPDKAVRVRRMFNHIAPRYELVNRLFSFGRDGAWRRRAVALARVTGEDDVLDVACGTGDFARAFLEANPRRIVGCDFAHDMLVRAATRFAGRVDGRCRRGWCESDAAKLPFGSGSFSVVSCAFGVRNFQDLSAGFAEMFRILRPGGRAVILEFSQPTNRWIRWLNRWYCAKFMPVVASWISGDRMGAYQYLPRSVQSFVDADTLAQTILNAGFSRCDVVPASFGQVTVHVGWRDTV